MIVRRIVLRAGLIASLIGLVGCTLFQSRSGELLYEDRFVSGESGAWRLEADTTGQSYIARESLIIEVDTPDTVQFVSLDGQTFSDFKLGVDVTQTAGSPSSSFGVLFRKQGDQNHFYRVAITGTGRYLIEKHSPNGIERLTEGWVKTDLLPIGLNQTQRLEIVTLGSGLSLFINGEMVTTVSDPEFSSGQIAFSAGTFNSGELQVAFDNLSIITP